MSRGNSARPCWTAAWLVHRLSSGRRRLEHVQAALGGALSWEHMALRHVLQQVVGEDECHHGLDHGHGPRHDAWVVAAAGQKLRLFAPAGDRFLPLGDGGRRLEGEADDDVLAVGDSALHAPRAVGAGPSLSKLVDVELVVVLAAGHAAAGEAGADLKALGRGQRHQRFRQISLELVKDRGAEAPRATADDTRHLPAARLAAGPDLVHGLDHLVRRDGVRAADHVALDLLHGEGAVVDVAADVTHTVDVSKHLRPSNRLEQLLGHGSGCHSADGLPRGRTAATSDSTDPILEVVCGIGM
mmetsp:Transcript_20517/g.48853  ORF Transcript_20517/g.48853 Transcript_20517/m.48853 type:complete len:299 (+) Transcript_20517:1246-2142(+)